MEGWIKLHRKLVDWEWYTDNPCKIVFIHLLLTANHKPQKWQGQTIDVGEKITSLSVLADETGLTIKQVRLALQKLESTGEIERKGANKYTRLKVCNYSVYQCFDDVQGQTKGNQKANKGQSKGNQRATNKNDKNEKNERNINIYGEFENVKLTAEEYEKVKTLGLLPLIEELSCYIAQKGDKYKSHYATIRAWGRKREAEKPKQKIKSTYDLDKISHDTMYNDDYDI